MASETTPLIGATATAGADAAVAGAAAVPFRQQLYRFLEAQTPAGRWYESFMVLLIVVNVVAFIVGSLFLPQYNPEPWASRGPDGLCGDLCDALWFGNFPDNGLEGLNIGRTSVLEIVTVAAFSIEYVLRLYTADLESDHYQGWAGRLRYLPTFFSLVDLAATVPFYLDSFLLRDTDLAASSFLRMFRLLRMMRVEGRYDTALTLIDDVLARQRSLLVTALFVGATTWVAVSALYYLAERRNPAMIYCPTCADVDGADCAIDHWGLVDCAAAGCPPGGSDGAAEEEEPRRPCYSLYESIPMASYYALLNLFGEYPLIDQHSAAGQVVGTLTAVVAVAVFALPAGIIGNGFERVLAERREARQQQQEEEEPITEESGPTVGFYATDSTLRGRIYNVFHAGSTHGADIVELFINTLVVITSVSFMLETLADLPMHMHAALERIELFSVVVFTAEYALRMWSIVEDPKYVERRISYATSFMPLVDLLSFAPFWLEVLLTGMVIPFSEKLATPWWGYLVKSLRLLRILRFERYTHAFLSFDDVIQRNLDVLAVTAFTAALLWIFFASCLYFTERDSADEEMAAFYRNIPNAMWVTLLNLSGESPLAQYSATGKIITGILGLFATAIFGIPIGVLGAGFEKVIEEEHDDNSENAASCNQSPVAPTPSTTLERAAYNFVNGTGSRAAQFFEALIYLFIFATVAVGAFQTIEGQGNAFHEIEWIAVTIFTVEYLIRFVGAGADPVFADGRFISTRLRFLVSFYSIIDLLAIVPFYIAYALPKSVVNEYDEYLRMLRILRLMKLDKYVPSFSLIDDVFRLKLNSLKVAFFAATTLWILFAAALFLCEHYDNINEIDPVPLYGCDSECTMADRFQSFFDSMVYTGIHLTGDYPIITYSWPARFVCFLMVVAAVGVVSIPSGIIASGFVEIVQSNTAAQRGTEYPNGSAGDDWYEHRYQALEGVDPPLSRWGPRMDRWQYAVNEFLNGKRMPDGHHRWDSFGSMSRIFIFAVIISNVAAVLLESIPSIDKYIGNDPGNFFDRFEFFSVMVFATEYVLRLFCAPKNREALYSSLIYATTFFGIVDFLSTAPWFIQQALIASGALEANGDGARIFRIFRIFRILQLEDFVTAFSKLDNVFRASKDVLKATGLLALIIWIGCGALFFIFEADNPNWRECDPSVPVNGTSQTPGCYEFPSTELCNEFYPGLCSQAAFTSMPNALYYTAVFLGGEWGVVDFTWPGRLVCLFLCIAGIALYAIPIGTLFDSFGSVLGLA